MAKKHRRGNNEGTIRKRADGRWEARITIGYDKGTGKAKYQSFYGKTRAEASEKMTEALHELNIGAYIEPNKITLGEWLDTWLQVYKKGARPTTRGTYEYIIRVHLKPALGEELLRQLQPHQLQKFFNELLEKGRVQKEKKPTETKQEIKSAQPATKKRKRKKDPADKKQEDKKEQPPGLSRATVEKIRTTVKAALSQAVEDGLLIKNPAKSTKLPEETEKKEVEPFTSEEAEKFLNSIKGHRQFAAYYIDLFAGLRRGETLGLLWDDIDFEAKTLKIVRELVSVKDEKTKKYCLIFQPPKTPKSQRTIPMTGDMIKVLKAHKAKQNEEKLFFGAAYHNENLVFCSEDGKRIWPRHFNRQYTLLLKKAGIPHKKPHTMRHTCASLLLEAGEELKVVQEILGHSRIGTTADIYSHLTEKSIEKSLDKMSTMIKVDLPENSQ